MHRCKEKYTAYGQMTDVNILPTRFMHEFFRAFYHSLGSFRSIRLTIP